MESQNKASFEQEPTGVQKDSETPTPKKPSVLFLVSTSIGVLLIILLVSSAYFGVAH
jgi:hypothetical protein